MNWRLGMSLRTLTSVLLYLYFLATSALALDCQKSGTEVEKIICGNHDLAEGYGTLDKKFSSVAIMSTLIERSMLTLFQERMLRRIGEDCGAKKPTDANLCIAEWFQHASETLRPKHGSGPGPSSPLMPVFHQQEPSASMSDIDLRLLRFVAAATPGEKLLNSTVAEIISSSEVFRNGNGEYTKLLRISFASNKLLSAASDFTLTNHDTGHFDYGKSNININMISGKEIEMSNVFSGYAATQLATDCKKQVNIKIRNDGDADFIMEKDDKNHLDEAVNQHINDWSRWSIYADEAIVTFDTASVSHSNSYECKFAMNKLKALAKPNAPLP
jgi:hypothetical protein